MWYENGQKKAEVNWKDGKLLSIESWKPNGDLCPLTYVKDGNGIAVSYNEDGSEDERETFKDGNKVKD
jgi:antitoxin component YwqK of YwqJK toxin-antitoxin module